MRLACHQSGDVFDWHPIPFVPRFDLKSSDAASPQNASATPPSGVKKRPQNGARHAQRSAESMAIAGPVVAEPVLAAPNLAAPNLAAPPREAPISAAIAPPAFVSSAPVIRGLGTASPAHGIHHQDAAEIAKTLSCDHPDQHRTVAALYRRTKINHRGSVLLDEDLAKGKIADFYVPPTSPADRGPTTKDRSQRYAKEAPVLANAAASAALVDADCQADVVTHLVTVSCTGFAAPGVDISLIKSLGLPPTTQRISVGFMGCHGAINGLRAAAAIAASDPAATVLMVSVELCSLHYQYGFDPDRIVSGALFADGAAAFVIGPHRDDGSGSITSQSTTSQSTETIDQGHGAAEPRLVATGSLMIDDSEDAMTWTIGDHGYEMTLSSRVPGIIDRSLKGFIDQFLSQHGYHVDSIGGWAVHPGGPRILDAVQSGMQLRADALETSRMVLSQHGNMSSATMPFILRHFIDTGQPGPWLMLGFGPGLEIEVALID